MAPLRQEHVLDASLQEFIQREATPSCLNCFARPSAAIVARTAARDSQRSCASRRGICNKRAPAPPDEACSCRVGLLIALCFLRGRVRLKESLYCGWALALCNVELSIRFFVSSTSVAIAALPTRAVGAGPPCFAPTPPPCSVSFCSRARSESFFSAWLPRSAWLLILLLLFRAWMLLSLK